MKFLANFEQKIFSSTPDYQPMGVWIYYTAAILGAVIGLLAVKDSAMAGNAAVSPVTVLYFISLCLMLWAVAVADSLIRIDNGATAAKKAVFNCLAIFAAMFLGAVAAIIVLVVVAVFLGLTMLGGAGKSQSRRSADSRSDIIGPDGNIHYVSSENADGSVSTTDGKRFRETSPGNWKEF
ncbi:MAG: hypothetical protein K2K68_05425 [Duncaniella sp.]|nr:hypothetical protein [Duncaniella sp.]